MTYNELLKETRIKKHNVLADFAKAKKGPTWFLVEAELKRNPGGVAWHYLAREFCEKLAEHIDEFCAEGDDSISQEVCEIYMAYEDNDPDIYDILPVEAQLFTAEAY